MTGSLIVLGATGAIGSRVVAAAVAAGRPVIAIARDEAALLALRERHAAADLVMLPASVASDGDAATLVAQLRGLGRPVAGVVAAICGDCGRGRLLDQPAEFLRRRLDEDLLPHLFAARHLLPLLAEHGHGGYVLIGGPGAEQPWAGYGHRSIGAAALRMLARVLHDEARAFPVRVQLLAVDSPVRTDDNARHACTTWPSADSIARRALAMLETQGQPQPTQAIVPYASHPLGFDLWSDDIDRETQPATRTPKPTASTPSAAATPTPSQETERGTALLPARYLQDARALLRSLGAPNPNPNQETSLR